MKKNTALKKEIKDEKKILYHEISLLKNFMTEYKILRKSDWKFFKNKIEDDINKLKKSIKTGDFTLTT